MEDPGGDGTGPALGYLDDGRGGWVMNCLACHAGKVAGQVVPGLPNSHYGLQTLTEEVRLVKLDLRKKLTHMDLGSLRIPLGATHGTTNSVVFGIALGALRDKDMNVHRDRAMLNFTHHDMDAPPFWNVKKKDTLYADGFAPKNHRMLMQFILIPSNGPKQLAAWEDDFRDILAWIESVEPPQYPWEIDGNLAARGETLFKQNCAKCHGTYGENGRYKQKTIPLDIVGTDPVRLKALTPAHRRWTRNGWLSHHGRDEVVVDPDGYVAPPLDGIWASAPYFHNGSVPTLWHVLNPDERPTVWRRTEDGYDREKLGLEVTEFEAVPSDMRLPSQRRTYFDTTRHGKSAAGHRFPNVLNNDEKRAVLEYLKTL
jgi:mono/diheme cytochrome c family protein